MKAKKTVIIIMKKRKSQSKNTNETTTIELDFIRSRKTKWQKTTEAKAIIKQKKVTFRTYARFRIKHPTISMSLSDFGENKPRPPVEVEAG